MIRRVVGTCVFTGAITAVIGCGTPAARVSESPFPVSFSATSDDGSALGGVAFSAESRSLGTTPVSGILEHDISGREGEILKVSISCPMGFAQEEHLAPLRLTRNHLVGSSELAPLAYHATCVRQIRDIIIVVRADQGAGLPVEVDGKPVTTTNDDGIAHALVQLERDDQSVAVSLDTTARSDLRPQHPSRTFELAGRDTLVVFDQGFVRAAPPTTRRTARPVRHIPYRVD